MSVSSLSLSPSLSLSLFFIRVSKGWRILTHIHMHSHKSVCRPQAVCKPQSLFPLPTSPHHACPPFTSPKRQTVHPPALIGKISLFLREDGSSSKDTTFCRLTQSRHHTKNARMFLKDGACTSIHLHQCVLCHESCLHLEDAETL